MTEEERLSEEWEDLVGLNEYLNISRKLWVPGEIPIEAFVKSIFPELKECENIFEIGRELEKIPISERLERIVETKKVLEKELYSKLKGV